LLCPRLLAQRRELRLRQAGHQSHARQVALREALRLERTLDVERLAEAASDVFASLEPLKPALRGLDLSAASATLGVSSAITASARAISAVWPSTLEAPISRIASQNRSSSLAFSSCTARCSSAVTIGMRACNAP
jgi:hypothetical protein